MSTIQTATIQNVHDQAQHISQDIPADYIGIYAFCDTIIFLGILLYCVIYKISEKWRIDNYKLKQLAIEKTGEQNISLLRKLDKVLEILVKDGTNR